MNKLMINIILTLKGLKLCKWVNFMKVRIEMLKYKNLLLEIGKDKEELMKNTIRECHDKVEKQRL